MMGLSWNDPLRIRTPQELLNYINQVGFLPLFANEVPGFSVEDHVYAPYWWCDDPEVDPWLWRQILAGSGEVAYGKFFNQKAGFVSLAWFPAFANYRRDGYDFDALWEDGLASRRAKKIMDLFEEQPEFYSFELKQKAGFTTGRKGRGKKGAGAAAENPIGVSGSANSSGGEKGFEGAITGLQMQGYLVVRDFKKRKRKKDGVEYGWPISVYTTPEALLGEEVIRQGYREDPEASHARMLKRVQEEYPWATEEQIRKVMG